MKTPAILAALLVIALSACDREARSNSGNASAARGEVPSQPLVESEFRHVWTAIHGEDGRKDGWDWKLKSFNVAAITPDGTPGTANAAITYTFEKKGTPVTEQKTFKFLKMGDVWQIEDREGANSSSSTKYKLTP